MPRFYKKKGGLKNTVRALVKKEMKNDAEKKHYKIGVSEITTIGSITSGIGSSQFVHLSAMALGTSISGRLGNEVKLTGLRLKIIIKPYINYPAGGDIRNFVRVMVVRSKGAILTTGDMPQSISNTNSGVLDRRDDNLYTVLYDKRIQLYNDRAIAESLAKSVDINLKLNNIRAQWDLDNAPTRGHVYMYVVSDVNNSQTQTPTMLYNSEVWFTDS